MKPPLVLQPTLVRHVPTRSAVARGRDHYSDNEPHRIIHWGVLAFLLIFINGLYFSYQWLISPDNSPIKNVQIESMPNLVDRLKLNGVIEKHIEAGFFGLDLTKLSNDLAKVDWIAGSRVRRVWPYQLVVQLTPQEPAALWNDHELVTNDYAVIARTQVHAEEQAKKLPQLVAKLPKLYGSPGRHAVLLDIFYRYKKLLQNYNLTLMTIKEDRRGALSLHTHTGMTIELGLKERDRRRDLLKKILAGGLEGALKHIQTLDLRYTNGFAVLPSAGQ